MSSHPEVKHNDIKNQSTEVCITCALWSFWRKDCSIDNDPKKVTSSCSDYIYKKF